MIERKHEAPEDEIAPSFSLDNPAVHIKSKLFYCKKCRRIHRLCEMSAPAPEISREVTMSMSDPNMVCHLKRDDCGHEAPHLISECGAFAAPEISDAAVERIARAIHASWRDGMLNQGRFVANERMAWATLTPRDQELDRAIARAALRAAQGGKNGHGI